MEDGAIVISSTSKESSIPSVASNHSLNASLSAAQSQNKVLNSFHTLVSLINDKKQNSLVSLLGKRQREPDFHYHDAPNKFRAVQNAFGEADRALKANQVQRGFTNLGRPEPGREVDIE